MACCELPVLLPQQGFEVGQLSFSVLQLHASGQFFLNLVFIVGVLAVGDYALLELAYVVLQDLRVVYKRHTY